MIWLSRLVALLPELVALWGAVESDRQVTLAQANLIRRMKDQQMREALARAKSRP